MKYKRGKKIETLREFVEIYMKSQNVFVGEAIVEPYKSKTLSLDYVEKCINEGVLFEAREDKPVEIWLNEYDEDDPLFINRVDGRFLSAKRYNTQEGADCGSCHGCIGQVRFLEVL